MQPTPSSGDQAWWQQSGQPHAPAAPAWVLGPPREPPTVPPQPIIPPRPRVAPSDNGESDNRAPVGPLDVRSLIHPTENSRYALALTVSLLVFGVVAISLVASGGSAILFEVILFLILLGASIWFSLQIARSRLLGGAVRVSEATLPRLQTVFNEIRILLDYHKPVDVYVADKVTGGSSMTSYLGTRIILLEGGLVAELLEEGHRAELTFLIGRHIGQLKAKHQRLQWVLIVIAAVDSLKFLQFFLAPYFRATVKSGDQIAAACCGDIRATTRTMNRLLAGKELGPQLGISGILDQAVTVRSRWLPRLAQLFQNEPHATNRYLNLLAFYAQTAQDQINAWRATLDPATASRLAAVLNAADRRRW